MNFRDHYSERAAEYAAHRPTYPSALVDYLADLTPHPGIAWDAGCGSGQLSVPLAARFDRVIATDASAEQVAKATPHPRVEYRCAHAEDSGLPDGLAHLAVSAQAAHWFDLERYYAEVRRVAAPGGAVALVTYGIMTVDDDVDRIVWSLYSHVLGRYWPPERRHVEDGYRSLPFPFDELASPAFDIRVRWTPDDILGYIRTWSAVRALEKAEGAARIEDFTGALANVWVGGVREVRWPLSVRAGRL